MKPQDTPKVLNTKSPVLSKPTRFRFPFKQLKSGITSGISSSTAASPVSPSAPGIFSLRKFKPTAPTLKKSVSFSSAGGSPSKDSNSMDWKKKISADHTDVAYREAVGRLRAILSPKATSRNFSDASKEDDQSISKPKIASPIISDKKDGRLTSSLRSIFSKESSHPNQIFNLNNQSYSSHRPLFNNASTTSAYDPANLQREDDLFGFIEKQSEYIAQLEKETRYTRDELSGMLDKVKDVIAENEELHQKQKKDILSNMIQQLNDKTGDHCVDSNKIMSNSATVLPNSNSSHVILESRVAELEAQLSQARRSLRLAQEEILEMRKGNINDTLSGKELESNSIAPNYTNCDLHRAEIDSLIREKSDLLDTMTKLKQMISELRDRESDAAKKVKNSLEIVDQLQVEKAQSDMETRRLKEELERHQKRILEMIQEHSKRLHEEKLQVERKYKQELDPLNNEMNIVLDSLTKARLDLERQKRLEADLRREIQQKAQNAEDIRQEMQMKINHLQSELASTLGHKSNIEQELINMRLNAEKADRDARQDASRLQAEINGLRKRLEQSDDDLVKSQEIIAKLQETIAHLQREQSLAKIRLEGHISENPELADADVVTIIQNMEEKHNKDMEDLEQLIQQQNGLLDKLRGECKTLTEKLEETTRQYKKERAIVETERDKFAQASRVAQEKCVELEQRVQYYSNSHEQMTSRLQKLEEEDKNRSARSCFSSFQANLPALTTASDDKPDGEISDKENEYEMKTRLVVAELSTLLTEISEWVEESKKDLEDDKQSESNPETPSAKEDEGSKEEEIDPDDDKDKEANESKEKEDEETEKEQEKGDNGDEGEEADKTSPEELGDEEEATTKEVTSSGMESKPQNAEIWKSKVFETNSKLEEWVNRIEIFQLLTKQSGLLRENQNLQNDLALMRSKLADQANVGSNRGA